MSGARLPVAALLAGLPGVAAAEPALLEADTLTLEAGVASGEGDVRARFGEQEATGARFTYDLERGLLVIEAGTWIRPEGALSFERAEVVVGDGSGLVLQGRFQGRDGRLKVEGQALRWVEAGELEGERVRLTTCSCARAPWSVSAREVRVRLDDVASFRGAWISVCEVPLVPVPAGRLPLTDRRSGLLFPLIGTGDDGLELGLPLYLTLGPAADLTLTPELRTARSGRLLSELRYALPRRQGGTLGAAGGWDFQTGGARGAVSLDHRSGGGPLHLGADALWWSDPDYGADYGDSFLSRQAFWTESLLFASLGPLRLESDTFQDDEVLGQRPVAAVLSAAGPAGPVAVRGEARVDAVGEGTEAWEADALDLRGRAAVQATAGRDLGWLRVDGILGARASSWLDGAPWAEGLAGIDLAVPMWAPSGAGVLLIDAGLSSALSAGLGAPDLRLPDDASPPVWSVGPWAVARRVGASGVPVVLGLWLPWTEDGLAWAASARLRTGPWEARAQAEPDLQEGVLAWDDGRGRLGLGLASAEALLQARGEAALTLPGRLSAWRPSWRGLVDVEEPTLLSHAVGLRYRPACDCVEAEASAAFSADRVLPQLGLRLQIW